jgi:hypothetical protein
MGISRCKGGSFVLDVVSRSHLVGGFRPAASGTQRTLGTNTHRELSDGKKGMEMERGGEYSLVVGGDTIFVYYSYPFYLSG